MLLEAVVVAAGLGLRLVEYSRGKPKFVVDLLGRPLLWYPVSTLVSAGVKRLTVVVPGGWKDALSDALEGIKGVEHSAVENHSPSRDNGYSLLLAEGQVSSDRFILSMCDHIYSREVVSKLVSSAAPDTDIVVAADGDPKFIDVAEATKIQTDADGKVLAIGKDLDQFNYVDAGVFLLSRRVFDVARDLERAKWFVRMSDIVTEAVKRGYKVEVADITGSPWTEVDTPSDIVALVDGDRRPVMEAVLRELGIGGKWGR